MNQKGEEAAKHNNLFFNMTYVEDIDLSAVSDDGSASLAVRSYKVVGIANSVMYLNHERGTSTLGGGRLTTPFFWKSGGRRSSTWSSSSSGGTILPSFPGYAGLISV